MVRIEFIFRVEFKLSSNIFGAGPARGSPVYAFCLARSGTLAGSPRRRSALRPVPPRIGRFPLNQHDYQRIYKTKGLPSDATGGPFSRFSEFQNASGLLVIGGPFDARWYEF